MSAGEEIKLSRPSVTEWRLAVDVRARRARADLSCAEYDSAAAPYRDAAESALAVVDKVVNSADGARHTVASWWSGWRIEEAWRMLHEAEVNVAVAVRDLGPHLPGLRERIASHLPADDVRRIALEQLEPSTPPSVADRVVVVDALRAAFDASDDAHSAARALRNKLVIAGAALFVLNTLVGIACIITPGLIPLCSASIEPGHQNELVCPSGGNHAGPADVWLVQVLGAFGAMIAVVVLLIRRRPSLSPYILIGYQALIKVLLGSALAVVGVLGLGAGVVRGLANIGSPAAMLLWAVLLGYAQEVGTRLLDNYADRVMNQARPIMDLPGHR